MEITAETVAAECKKLNLRTLPTLNNFIFEHEIKLFPLNGEDYKVNHQSKAWYVSVMKLLKIEKNFKRGKHMLFLRDRLRGSRIEDLIMKRMGFTFSKIMDPFPEGHQFEKLFELYAEKKDPYVKVWVAKMIMLTQNKWNPKWGLFPAKSAVKNSRNVAARLVED
jgi:hypothetical protein